jgi:hypothetical protein
LFLILKQEVAMTGRQSFTAVLGLAFDVEKASSPSGFKPARFDQGAQKELFADVRLLGFAAALKSGLAQRIIIAGGDEGRYKGEEPVINRAEAIRLMLIRDHGIDPELVTAYASRSNTGGNIAIFAEKIVASRQAISSFALMSNLYHLPRAMVDLAAAGFSEVIPVPAEAAILFQHPKDQIDPVKSEIIRMLGEGPLAERVAEEAAGIADKLRGSYEARTDTEPFRFSSSPQKA